MSATTTGVTGARAADRPGVRTRARVGWGDVAWLTWRQHRWTVLGTLAIALVGVAGMLLVRTAFLDEAVNGYPADGWGDYTGMAFTLPGGLMLYGTFIGAVWGAPMLAWEYDQRTHVVAWTQDLPVARWLVGKAALLGAVAALIGAALGGAAQLMATAINDVPRHVSVNMFEEGFEFHPALQAAYALFGFALGLAIAALVRRTVLAVGLTMVVGLLAKAVVELWLRGRYQSPHTTFAPVEDDVRPLGLEANQALYLEGGHATADGVVGAVPPQCYGPASADRAWFQECLAESGLTHFLEQYHPAERLGTFRLIEGVLFLVLAAALFALALRRVKKAAA
ncbi:ABC transporter permease [Actinosynnema mirum]|uniref:Transmembrane transport protein n=1 Tax=Actinosynnema mirum (strain ATCC 29888 / DSM 43827 / JCM 3225 / NBRC 14064 / NCIMB 13271 / NRRL B-12336 / IMRU 3971 / 101) TaxID=446462 RepID=C6WKB9_ACTMD|nr:ABC transporter permease [Actinosynnema mirum]ACU40170.1 hypothetical protein Amir_6369 [Actinosynnema mirum DSM 43827]